MADPRYWDWMAVGCCTVIVVTSGSIVLGAVVACLVFIFKCIRKWWQSPRILLFRFGGVTTLRRNLSYGYRCHLCHDHMVAGEKVARSPATTCSTAAAAASSARASTKGFSLYRWSPARPVTRFPIPCRGSGNRHRRHHLYLHREHRRHWNAISSRRGELFLTHNEKLPEASTSVSAPPLAQSPARRFRWTTRYYRRRLHRS
jgi:hypothetical protein